MTNLSFIPGVSAAAREVLAKHHVLTLAALASFETRDSFADAPPIDNLRGLARRARQELGLPDPMRMTGAAAGQRGPVKYAGNVRFGDN